MLHGAHGLTAIGLALLAISTAWTPAAQAADDGPVDEAITWTVRPSDGVGEDGRSWVELDLEPGEIAHDHLLLRNLSRETVTFNLYAADGYFTDTGRFNMLTSDRESIDAGTWITIEGSVEVASGAEVVVPFSVSVPSNATPGDHAAGVAAAIRSGGDAMGIESRVGFRVMTRVAGELAPRAVVELAGVYSPTWNPFEAGKLNLEYTVTNTGNTRLTATPHITATALFGLVTFTVEGDEIAEFAPGESRLGRASISAAWPLFLYVVESTITTAVVSGEHAPAAVQPATATASVGAIPWTQLGVIILAALLLWWVRSDRRARTGLGAFSSKV